MSGCHCRCPKRRRRHQRTSHATCKSIPPLFPIKTLATDMFDFQMQEIDYSLGNNISLLNPSSLEMKGNLWWFGVELYYWYSMARFLHYWHNILFLLIHVATSSSVKHTSIQTERSTFVPWNACPGRIKTPTATATKIAWWSLAASASHTVPSLD